MSGDGGEFRAARSVEIFTFGSPITRTSVACTSSVVASGRMRQFTLARARCGSALGACPPQSIVATHDVRICELYAGSVDSVAIALAFVGSFASVFIASPIAPGVIAAERSK